MFPYLQIAASTAQSVLLVSDQTIVNKRDG